MTAAAARSPRSMPVAWQAGVGLAEGPEVSACVAEHHVGMLGETAVDADCALVFGRRREPRARSSQARSRRLVARGACGRTGCRRRHRCRRRRGNCLRAGGSRRRDRPSRRCARAPRRPPCPSCRCEVTKAASPPGFSRSIEPGDEIVVQAQAERPKGRSLRTVRSEKGGLPIARSKCGRQLGPREIPLMILRLRLQAAARCGR